MNRVVDIVEECCKIGVRTLTLYAFSTENWKRPEEEVNGLMNILVIYINSQLKRILENNIVFRVIGDYSKLPDSIVKLLEDSINKSKNNNGMVLNIALNYGGRAEIIASIKKLYDDILKEKFSIDNLNEESFKKYLYTKENSDVDLMIRTGNEKRISNFLIYQLAYSDKNKGLEIDLVIFVNGLPVITMELKSRASSTGWTYKEAEEQYKNDRDSKEALFSFKRCIAHFAADENFVTFTTKLDGKNTRFMPFNKGTELGGSGNPINNGRTMTDYLWKEFLKKKTLTSLIRDFAYISADKVKKTETLIFPRYHQYRAVTRLVDDVQKNGVGNRYLIQHSAGSGKSNSITWLAYRLVEAEYNSKKAFDSVIVVTDRLNLDKQINDNIRKFIDEKSIVGHANSSADLKKLLVDGKKIIITTVQKFPYLLEKIGTELKGKNFAVIIDEAHSSQSGRAAASLNMAVSGNLNNNDEFEIEDKLNELIEARKMPDNASFFAFTATPKAKTVQMFGSVVCFFFLKKTG